MVVTFKQITENIISITFISIIIFIQSYFKIVLLHSESLDTCKFNGLSDRRNNS